MKQPSIRTLALAAATVFSGLASTSPVSADPSVTIHIGSQAPPPPPQEDHQWARPYHTAVWIPGHNEWRDGQYVWVGGYYDYPPHRHSHWVSPSYSRHQDGYSYRPGHWSN
jgi:hypothetical protein